MRLSNAANYAIRALVHMANRKDNALLISREVALEEGIPDLYLMKVLRPLVTRGILRSIKGPNGGYSLARNPREITLLDILEAVDGPVRGQIPFEGQAARALERRLQAVCDQAAEEARRHFRKVRLSDLSGKRQGTARKPRSRR
jgi:Rrf2 family protein